MDLFNNREIATIFWGAVFVIWAALQPGILASSKELIRVLCGKYIVLPVIILSCYIAGATYLLYTVGLWDPSHLKNTIVWSVAVAVVTLFRSLKAVDNPYYFSDAVKDQFKIIIIFEFIVTFYSFNLFVELIAMPIMTVIVMIHAFSENKEQYSSVIKFSEILLSIYALFALTYAGYMVAQDVSGFANKVTIIVFVQPILLSFLLFPFLYIFVIYASYEKAASMLKLSLGEDLVGYAIFWAAVYFRSNRTQLLRWCSIQVSHRAQTKKEVIESIHKVERMIAAEKRCDAVGFKNGWSPYKAKYFLSSVGLTTRFYNPIYDDEWFSSAPYLVIGGDNSILHNNIGYSIEGDETFVKSLNLTLYINEPVNAAAAENEYIKICSVLFISALNRELPVNISELIMSGEEFELVVRGREVSLVRHNWVGRDAGCYDLVFNIRLNTECPDKTNGGCNA